MPPRKKAKGSALAQAFAAGAYTPASATTVDDLPRLQLDAMDLVEGIYSLRHAKPTDVHTDPLFGMVPKDGLYPWPICHGGTFKDIAQRAFEDSDRLVSMSTELAFQAGLLEVQDDAEFLQHYCKLDVSWILLLRIIEFSIGVFGKVMDFLSNQQRHFFERVSV